MRRLIVWVRLILMRQVDGLCMMRDRIFFRDRIVVEKGL